MGYENLPFFPAGEPGAATRAWIDAPGCIGCARCLQVCPVDAIIGVRQRMHTIIAEACTGCARCVAPCPTGCIRIAAAPSEPDLATAFTHYRNREERLARTVKARRGADPRPAALAVPRREIVEAAVARARERIAQRDRQR